MEIGKLNKRITFQKLENITNENGFTEEKWTDFKTVWASATNLHGREFFQAATVNAEQTVKFGIRYLKDLDSKQRILFEGKQYNITNIDDIKYRKTFMQISALAVI